MNVQIVKSVRKTISIDVKPDFTVIVKAPLFMSNRQIKAFIDSKHKWIESKIDIMRNNRNEKSNAMTQDEINKLIKIAKDILPPKVELWAEKIGVKYNRITIRCQKTRWGSCSSKNNLNFNCLLTICPDDVVDYVIIHELCHLKELNHSSAFWNEVAKFCPNYKEHRKWLRENGIGIIKN